MKAASKKILIADDDSGIVDSLTMMLEMMGYDVDFTYDGATVPDAAQKHADLILLDIFMSGHDGREICKKLKSNSETKNIPVLMISASHEIKQSAIDAGADDFLEKPFEMNALITKVNRLVH